MDDKRSYEVVIGGPAQITKRAERVMSAPLQRFFSTGNDRIEIKVTRIRIKPRESVGEEALHSLRAAHLAILIVPDFGWEDLGIRDLIVRCHEQKIMTVVITNQLRPQKDCYPLALQNDRFFVIEGDLGTDAGCKLVVGILRNKLKSHIQDQVNDLLSSMIRGHVQICRVLSSDQPPSPSFKPAMMRVVAMEAESEILSMTGPEFEIDIGLAKSFLQRGTPLFNAASRVYAVSLARVSEFWVKQENRELVKRYIQKQPERTCRLFVFSTPDEAHYYVKLLDFHSRSYGKTGIVAICSEPNYRRLLEKYKVVGNRQTLKDEDFGVLWFEHEQDNAIEKYEARLSGVSLSFREIGQDKSCDIDHARFAHCMESLKDKLRPGEVDENGIMSWKPGFHREKQAWARRLQELFGERTADYYHFVFFNTETESCLGADGLGHVRDNLRQSEQELGIKRIWLGKLDNTVPAKDGTFGFELHKKNNPQQQYVLMMNFASRRDLEEYYQHAIHSAERKTVYLKFCPALKPVFRVPRPATDRKRRRNRSESDAAKVIELVAESFMQRQDYVELEEFENIVTKRPYLFPS